PAQRGPQVGSGHQGAVAETCRELFLTVVKGPERPSGRRGASRLLTGASGGTARCRTAAIRVVLVRRATGFLPGIGCGVGAVPGWGGVLGLWRRRWFWVRGRRVALLRLVVERGKLTAGIVWDRGLRVGRYVLCCVGGSRECRDDRPMTGWSPIGTRFLPQQPDQEDPHRDSSDGCDQSEHDG